MDALQQLLNDPQNRIIAYGIAAFLVLDSLALFYLARHLAKRKGPDHPEDTVVDMRRARGAAPMGPATLLRGSAVLSLATGVVLAVSVYLVAGI